MSSDSWFRDRVSRRVEDSHPKSSENPNMVAENRELPFEIMDLLLLPFGSLDAGFSGLLQYFEVLWSIMWLYRKLVFRRGFCSNNIHFENIASWVFMKSRTNEILNVASSFAAIKIRGIGPGYPPPLDRIPPCFRSRFFWNLQIWLKIGSGRLRQSVFFQRSGSGCTWIFWLNIFLDIIFGPKFLTSLLVKFFSLTLFFDGSDCEKNYVSMYMYMIPQNECFSNYVSTFTKGKLDVSVFSKRAQDLPLISGGFICHYFQETSSQMVGISLKPRGQDSNFGVFWTNLEIFFARNTFWGEAPFSRRRNREAECR